MQTWTRRGLAVVAFLYPASLVAAVLLMRWIGEDWWATDLALYLPWAFSALPLPFIAWGLFASKMRRLLLTQAVAAFVIVFPLMGFVLPSLARGRAGSATLRVLSYNVNSGYGGADHLIEEIERFSPDIVFLQETNRDTKLLADSLQRTYAEVRISTQFIVASRFPIVSFFEPERLSATDERSPRFVKQILSTPLGDIAFYNVHPISPRGGFYKIRGGGLKREILSGRIFTGERADGMQGTAELRDLQVRAFAELAAHESYPVIIVGDTNLPGQSAIFRRYLSSYQDGFRAAGAGFGYTFPANKHPWLRLDRILAATSLKFVRFELGQSTASDHFCVVADVGRDGP